MPEIEIPAHVRYPRGSAFWIYSNCDVSFELQQKAGEEPATVFADKGTKLHSAWAGRVSPTTLSREEFDDWEDGEDRYQLALRTWLQGEEKPHLLMTEHRFWMRMGLRPIYSGQPDKVAVVGPRAFIPDFKSGWHPPDAISATNSQLRSYVPLVHQEIEGIEEITVKIVKPGKQDPAAVFNKEAILDATAWAIEVVGRIKAPGEKKPNRGAWCQYCSGKVLCPLWQDELKSLAVIKVNAVAEITDQVLREMGPRLAIAKKVIERLEAWLEKRVKEAPELFPEWRVEPGDERRKIVNLSKAFAVLHEAGVTPDEFIAACDAPVGELESLYKIHKQLKGAAAQAEFNKALGDAIEKKRNRDKLVYIPALPESAGNGQATKPEEEHAELPFV